jgi:hypothetical protein
MLGGGDRKVRYTYNTATRLSKAMRRVDDKRQKKSQRVQSYISYYNDKSKTAAHVSVWPLFFSFFSLSLWLSRGNENCRPDGHIPAINKDSTTFASAKSLLILFHYSAAFRSIWGFYAATRKSIVSYRLMSSIFPRRLSRSPRCNIYQTRDDRSLPIHARSEGLSPHTVLGQQA